ncbi:MAG: hypothetical protein EOO62_22200, partial [Hymenobacter sp.]
MWNYPLTSAGPATFERATFRHPLLVRLLTLYLILLFASPQLVQATTRADSLLAELNQALARRPHYEAQRLHRLASLKAAYAASAHAPATQFQLGLRIYNEYKAFKYDSAFAYCQRINRLADQLGDPQKVAVARLKLAFILLSSGLFTETFATLAPLRAQQLSSA